MNQRETDLENRQTDRLPQSQRETDAEVRQTDRLPQQPPLNPELPLNPTDVAATERSAVAGDLSAQRWMGTQCLLGSSAVPKSLNRAFFWWYMAAQQGDPEGQFWCGTCYALGLGVEVHPADAKFWLRRAAQQGHPYAQYACDLYEEGQGGRPFPLGFYWLTQAASDGDERARVTVNDWFERWAGQTK
jgi:TPR repeat protein